MYHPLAKKARVRYTSIVNDRKINILELRKEGKTYDEISSIFNTSRQRVHQIIKNYKSTNPRICKRILARDKNSCIICSYKIKLEVHHINGIKTDNNENNLVTLCSKCHVRVELIDRKTVKPPIIKLWKKIRIKKECLKCKKCFVVLPCKNERKFCSSKCFFLEKKIYTSVKEKNHAAYLRRKVSAILIAKI